MTALPQTNEKEVMDMEDLKIKFDGQTHQIEANTLINSLLHFNTIVQEINKELKTDKTISIKINALPEGSFLVHFTLEAYGWLKQAQELFSGKAASSIANIIAYLTAIYSVARFLGGKKAKTIENKGETTIITNQNGDTMIIENLAINIYLNNKKIQESLNQEMSVLDADPNVTGFEMLNKNDEPIIQIERKDFASMAGNMLYIEESTDRIINKVAMLNIVRLSFDRNQKWEFYYEGNKISAKINEDDEFLKRIDSGEQFAKGDSLEVEIEIRQEFDNSVNTYINKIYKINKIINHIPRPPQSRLELN